MSEVLRNLQVVCQSNKRIKTKEPFDHFVSELFNASTETLNSRNKNIPSAVYLVRILRVGEQIRFADLSIERAQDVVKHFSNVGIVMGKPDAFRRVLRQHFVQESLLNSQRTSGGHHPNGSWHRWFAFFLLEGVGDDQDGAEANGHPLRSINDLSQLN